MTRTLSLPLLTLAMLACNGGDDPGDPSPAIVDQEAFAVSRVEVVSTSGNAPLEVWVRAVNTLDGGVAGGVVSVTVDGTPRDVAVDSNGYGTLTFAQPGVYSVTGSSDTETIWVYDSEWPGFDMMAASTPALADPIGSCGITTGALVHDLNNVHWVGANGQNHRVLNTEAGITGMSCGHLDIDGVQDAVVWTDDTMYLLRGRAGGGMGFGYALQAVGYTVTGVALGDVSGDSLPDLVVTWLDGDSGLLDVWEGDGLWGFRDIPVRRTLQPPVSVAIGNNTASPRTQITALTVNSGGATGEWERFFWAVDGAYVPIGPQLADLNLPPEGQALSGADVNGDGGDELFFADKRVSGQPRQIFMFDLLELNPTVVSLSPIGAYLHTGDVNDDDFVDMVMLAEDGQLTAVAFDSETADYRNRTMTQLGSGGPVAVTELDRLPGMDVLAANSVGWRWLPGSLPAETFWAPRDFPQEDLDMRTDGPMDTAELDGDNNTTEIVTFDTSNGDTRLAVYSVPRNGGTAQRLGAVVLSNTALEASVLDVSVCGTNAFVGTGDAVHRVRLNNPSNPNLSDTRNSSVKAVDCLDADSVAVLTNAQVEQWNANFSSSTNSVSAPGANDVAFADTGSGPEFFLCEAEGCSAVSFDLGGVSGAAWTSADGRITVRTPAGESRRSGEGTLSAGDVDGDGREDVIAVSDGGVVAVYRATSTDLGRPELFHTLNTVANNVVVADRDGDGYPELVYGNGDRGFASMARPVPEPDLPDTGDTGDTGGTDTGAGL